MEKLHPIKSLSNLYDQRIDPWFALLGERLDLIWGSSEKAKPNRSVIYGVASLIALCIPLTYYVFDWTFLRERAFIYLLIFYFNAVAVKHIFSTVDYSPGYKYVKALGGASFLFLSSAVMVNLTTVSAVSQWAYGLMALVVHISSLEFILLRNKNLLRRLLHTRRGLVPIPPTRDECDHLADIVASLVQSDEVSPWARSGIARSLGFPIKMPLEEILVLDIEDFKVRKELRKRLAKTFGLEDMAEFDEREAGDEHSRKRRRDEQDVIDELAREGRRAAPSS